MSYIFNRPTRPSFTYNGLSGYTFGPLRTQRAEIQYLDVSKGHDTYQISKSVTRVYYVISGNGYFTINGARCEVVPGVVIEVPPRVEYSYSGTMELLVFSTPRWFRGNDISTRWNPDVVGPGIPWTPEDGRWWRRAAQLQLLGKSPARAFLRLNQRLWSTLPSSLAENRVIQGYGRILHKLARAQGDRSQALSTFFMRNRPELELIGRLASRASHGEKLRVAVLGCSSGAEAYSVAWTIKSARPDLRLVLQAVDISAEAVQFAQRGVYSKPASALTGTAVLDRMSAAEVKQVFDENDGSLTVKSWIREGISWSTGDAGDPRLVEKLGPQDIVIANNFLCHMQPRDAERCLHNIARLVSNGHLFVGGIDLDVRTRVARRLGWEPVEELLEEIHEGDPCVRGQWPCQYAGLEPLDKSRKEWKLRYASVFRIVSSETERPAGLSSEVMEALTKK